jgi:hypothetical protein
MYTPIGGVSSRIHTVRRADFDADVERIDEDEMTVYVDATADQNPIRGANVTVRVTPAKDDTVVGVVRGRTDNRGRAEIPFRLPKEFDPQDDYEAEVVLSPTLGSGPADTTVPFRFT